MKLTAIIASSVASAALATPLLAGGCAPESEHSEVTTTESKEQVETTAHALGGNAIIVDYVGAYPAGRAAPDVSQVPTSSTVDFYFGLAFARDLNRDGAFTPVWDTWSANALTPDRIAQLRQGNGRRKFLASLGGGDNFPWQDPRNVNGWVANAVASLEGLMDRYHLDGIDVNYENNLNSGVFVTAVGQVIQRLKQERGAVITVTPFGATWQAYLALYRNYGSSIDAINYQAYAEFGQGSTPGDYVNRYAQLVQDSGAPYGKFTLGIATATGSGARGMQPPAIYDALRQLRARGLLGAEIWTLEDSVLTSPAYAVETSVESVLQAGATPTQGALNPGESLAANQSISSCDGRYSLVMQGDSNLVLYQNGAGPLWAAGTWNKGANVATMQTDGNFVVYSGSQPLWASNTAGNAGALLALQNDGNLVVYGSNSRALWSTDTHKGTCGQLFASQSLGINQSISSCDGRFSLVMQSDSNLVLYQNGVGALWAAGTWNKGATVATMQTDGNFVVYSGSQPLWASNTWGDVDRGSRLAVQDDGNLVVYGPKCNPLWATGTSGH